ncbi:MAG: CinA family protein [Rhodospirillales bacterium]|nr:MAG: CinA family protein [Rhodospirillales bacterium]
MTETLPKGLVQRAALVMAAFREAGLKLATAESCTGGLIAACMTELAGSSHVFERGFVTYANEAKQELLGVPGPALVEHGAVSEQVALHMALGALDRSRADIAIAVTGVAGPGGGSPEKPVGLVFVAGARRNAATHADHNIVDRHVFTGDRAQIREATVLAALDLALNLAEA